MLPSQQGTVSHLLWPGNQADCCRNFHFLGPQNSPSTAVLQLHSVDFKLPAIDETSTFDHEDSRPAQVQKTRKRLP